MRFLIFIFLTVNSSAVSELEQENGELRTANEILHKQLMELSQLNDMSTAIREDYQYNKEKLSALLEEYSAEAHEYIRVTLAEQIQYYMNILYEDVVILGGLSDGVSASEVENCKKVLENAIEQFKSKQQNQEFNKAYSELKIALNRKDETLKTLQLENAKLIGQLDSVFAELEQATQRYQHNVKKLDSLTEELEKTRIDQSKRLENLKNTLQTEEQNSRTKEIEDFKKIQNSQDNLILKLESKNAEQSLKIEQLSMEKVNLLSKIRLLSSTIERLETEISARSSQLEISESKFEEFRRQIEYETNDEIINLRNSEE